jgi:hypothetical protein
MRFALSFARAYRTHPSIGHTLDLPLKSLHPVITILGGIQNDVNRSRLAIFPDVIFDNRARTHATEQHQSCHRHPNFHIFPSLSIGFSPVFDYVVTACSATTPIKAPATSGHQSTIFKIEQSGAASIECDQERVILNMKIDGLLPVEIT